MNSTQIMFGYFRLLSNVVLISFCCRQATLYKATEFELAFHESRFTDQLCPFAEYFKQFFVKFANQNLHSFPSRIFVFRETKKFLITLQARQFAFIFLQKVSSRTLFSVIWIAFWLQTPNEELTALPHTPKLLELPTKFLQMTSEKIIRIHAVIVMISFCFCYKTGYNIVRK